MFVEPNFGFTGNRDRQGAGWVEIICGAMFSGKTEELIRRLNRALIARQKVEIFKPVLDKRYHEKFVVSHDLTQIRSTSVQFSNDIYIMSGDSDVIGIDEAQFFDNDLVEVVNRMANKGKRIIIAGLDMDYRGIPFGPMPSLMAIAEFVTKVHPICIKCGRIASYSHRLTADEKRVVVGQKETYEPLCRSCFEEIKN